MEERLQFSALKDALLYMAMCINLSNFRALNCYEERWTYGLGFVMLLFPQETQGKKNADHWEGKMHSKLEISDFIRPCLRDFAGVKPNKSIDLFSDKIPPKEILKLNANENPYGCSPKVNRALQECDNYHIYPDAGQNQIREMLAAYTGLPSDQIVAGAGGEQIIDLLVRLFVDPRDEVITCPPTFVFYDFSTRLCGGIPVQVPRDEYFDIEVKKVLKAVTERTKLIFLCNPNNPTGNMTSREDLLEIAKIGVPTVIDEAYYEYTGKTLATMIAQYPNIMIIRTLSKWAGMAGFRMGYGLFTAKIAASLRTIKPPFSVSVPAQIALKASLEDKGPLLETVKKVIRERDRLFQAMREIDFLKPYPGYGNFLFCDLLEGDAAQLTGSLEGKGILVRHYNVPGLRRGIRISVGTREANDKLLFALREWGK